MTHIYIFDKRNGNLINECIAPAMFAYHHINAFEGEGGEINLYLNASNNSDSLLNIWDGGEINIS